MVHLKIKEVKNQLYIQLNFDYISELKEQLMERLAPLCSTTEVSAFFCLPALEDDLAVAFLKLCRELNFHVLGINYEEPAYPATVCMEGNIRSGERLQWNVPVQLFGSIRSSASVSCSYSLSVFGEISGIIDLFCQNSVLYASSLSNAHVRIADSAFFSFSSERPCKVIYERQQLKCIPLP